MQLLLRNLRRETEHRLNDLLAASGARTTVRAVSLNAANCFLISLVPGQFWKVRGLAAVHRCYVEESGEFYTKL
jgi:hypothetical protein